MEPTFKLQFVIKNQYGPWCDGCGTYTGEYGVYALVNIGRTGGTDVWCQQCIEDFRNETECVD